MSVVLWTPRCTLSVWSGPYGNNALYVPELQKIVIFGSKYPPSNAPQPAIPGFLSLPIVFASQVNLPSSLGQITNTTRQPRTMALGAKLVFNTRKSRTGG